MDRLGPIGFGAEQIAPTNSLLYPGQSDMQLQTAWPNAWESMSTYVDAIMAFLDWTPDAANNKLIIAPKLPEGWAFMNYNNISQGPDKFDVRLVETARSGQVTIGNRTGFSGKTFDVWIKVPQLSKISKATINGVSAATIFDTNAGRVRVQGAIAPGIGARTVIRIEWTAPRNSVNPGDFVPN